MARESRLLGTTMSFSMTIRAQGDQVTVRIYTAAASEFLVVYLQLRHSATILASPPISLKYLPVKSAIGRGI